MSDRFDYFIVFAEMRTGSNFLETNLNALDGVSCHGEAFNPQFIGYPKTEKILSVTQIQRDKDPKVLLEAIKSDRKALGGFRYFHDHDSRVLDTCLDDPRCAKIILTRNPAESYISWRIAQETGQWKLTDMKARKDGKATFDAKEFDAHVTALQTFQVSLLNRLQVSGQTAFYIDYEDLQSVEVMNGLAKYLGVQARLDGLDKTLKKQNPSSLVEKVANFQDMEIALAGVDRYNLTRTPNFEPRRGPAVPTYVAAAEAPLLYVPIKGGPEVVVETWLADLDGVRIDDLHRKMSQKDVRQWKRRRPGHRSFSVLRHPLSRAHHAFCTKILNTGPDSYPQLRQTLKRRYKLPIPDGEPDANWGKSDHKAAFAAFLKFLKGNLNGQTGIRVDATWCTQAQALQGFAEFIIPDLLIREEDMASDLPKLAVGLGLKSVELLGIIADTPFLSLEDIYDGELEELGQAAYQRDYMMFGFGPFKPL
ncbi:MAG: nodulation protein NodH [Aliishimia sp.]